MHRAVNNREERFHAYQLTLDLIDIFGKVRLETPRRERRNHLHLAIGICRDDQHWLRRLLL